MQLPSPAEDITEIQAGESSYRWLRRNDEARSWLRDYLETCISDQRTFPYQRLCAHLKKATGHTFTAPNLQSFVRQHEPEIYDRRIPRSRKRPESG